MLVSEAKAAAKKAAATAEPAGPFTAETPASGPLAYTLPFWKYCLLLVASCSMYELVWFYKTWSFVKKTDNARGTWAKIGATVGCAVPVVSLFFLWKLLSEVRRVAGENKLPVRFSVKYLFIFYQLLCFSRLVYDRVFGEIHGITGPHGLLLFGLSFALLISPCLLLFSVQRSINDYWQAQGMTVQGGKFNLSEKLVTAIGICFWLALSSGLYLLVTGQIDSAGNYLTGDQRQ